MLKERGQLVEVRLGAELGKSDSSDEAPVCEGIFSPGFSTSTKQSPEEPALQAPLGCVQPQTVLVRKRSINWVRRKG